MNRFARTTLLSVIVAAACSDQANPDVSFQFRETPLRQLTGVEIGMPASALRASRPAVAFAPVLGLREAIPGYLVSYEFKSAALDPNATAVPPSDILRGIYMVRNFDGAEQAAAGWTEEVAGVTSARRAPESCRQFPNGGREARWFSSKMSLAVGLFPPEPNSTTVGWRVITALTTMDAMRQPPGGAAITCPIA
jgi:hypothetical protein